jgi:MFS family permease
MDELRNFISGARRNGATPPRLLKFRSSTGFILTTICLAVFTDIFLYAVIVPVIPFAIGERAGVPESDVQRWVSVLLAVYGGALLVASPIAGWYADNSSSRRFPLLVGLLALAGATLMLCLAQAVWLLVLGRVLQGISAAIVWTVGTALLVDTVGMRYIGQTMGYVSISMSLGILIAPLLGGVVSLHTPVIRPDLTQNQGV